MMLRLILGFNLKFIKGAYFFYVKYCLHQKKFYFCTHIETKAPIV